MAMCCKKKTMTGWRNVWSTKWKTPGQEIDQRKLGDTHTQPFQGSMCLVRDNPGDPAPEETFTHSHLSWSSIVPYLLHPSTTIHGILPIQSMHLTIFFHNLSPSFLWSMPWPGTLHSTSKFVTSLTGYMLSTYMATYTFSYCDKILHIKITRWQAEMYQNAASSSGRHMRTSCLISSLVFILNHHHNVFITHISSTTQLQ